MIKDDDARVHWLIDLLEQYLFPQPIFPALPQSEVLNK